MAFGVELPESFEAPPASAETGSPNGAAPDNKETKTSEPQVTDLDSLEKFKFQGRELTREELTELVQKAQQPQESEASKFDRAFRLDLDVVLKDPNRLNDFKSVYPPEYVQIVERLLGQRNTTPTSGQNAVDAAPKDPRFEEMYSTVQEFKAQQKEQRVQSFERQLDTSFEKLSKKFPEADPEVINSRCLALSQQGVQLTDKAGKIQDAVLEKLFKQDHDKRAAYYEQKYRAKVDAQKQANSRSRDMGTGGSVSSPSGKQPNTLKEATAALLADLNAAR